jgi:hypothetical protein
LNREIACSFPLENAIDVPCCLSELFRQINTIGNEPA